MLFPVFSSLLPHLRRRYLRRRFRDHDPRGTSAFDAGTTGNVTRDRTFLLLNNEGRTSLRISIHTSARIWYLECTSAKARLGSKI